MPIDSIDYCRLPILIGQANREISLYSGMLEAIPNVDVLLAPMTVQEAVSSSKIEGTQASFSEIFKNEAGEKYDSVKSADAQEVINYKNALLEAEEMFKTRPFIHLNMIKKLHEILLSGVRGENKSRGNFRNIQNYIGPYGCKIEDATYVPPEPQNVMSSLDNLEKFINRDDIEPLAQLSQIHAQFELIHPFLDGNGRIGRILIPLFLQQKQYIKRPVFYLSEYFENNRGLYYQKLNRISNNNEWNDWIEFFLEAICRQAKSNSQKVKSMIDLYNSMKQIFTEATKSEFAIKILDALFIKPIIKSVDLIAKTGIISKRSGRAIVQKLIDAKVIVVYKEHKGPNSSIIAFPGLINLVENRKVF
ncbi:MAG: Fic family protein [Holosporales bacterium]|nr:Fic family protein [Holosporales bacterium]